MHPSPYTANRPRVVGFFTGRRDHKWVWMDWSSDRLEITNQLNESKPNSRIETSRSSQSS